MLSWVHEPVDEEEVLVALVAREEFADDVLRVDTDTPARGRTLEASQINQDAHTIV